MYFLFDLKNTVNFAKKGQRMSDEEYLKRYGRSRKESQSQKSSSKKKSTKSKPKTMDVLEDPFGDGTTSQSDLIDLNVKSSKTPGYTKTTQPLIAEGPRGRTVKTSTTVKELSPSKTNAKRFSKEADIDKLRKRLKGLGKRISSIPFKYKVAAGATAVGITVGGLYLANKAKKEEEPYEDEIKATYRRNAYTATKLDRDLKRAQKASETLRNTSSAVRSTAYLADTVRKFL